MYNTHSKARAVCIAGHGIAVVCGTLAYAYWPDLMLLMMMMLLLLLLLMIRSLAIDTWRGPYRPL